MCTNCNNTTIRIMEKITLVSEESQVEVSVVSITNKLYETRYIKTGMLDYKNIYTVECKNHKQVKTALDTVVYIMIDDWTVDKCDLAIDGKILTITI